MYLASITSTWFAFCKNNLKEGLHRLTSPFIHRHRDSCWSMKNLTCHTTRMDYDEMIIAQQYFFFDGAVHYAKVSSILYGLMAPLLQTPILVPLQLELIQHYCDGCSANVDLSKFLHPLNRSIPRPRISDCYRLGWIFRSSTEHCI